MAIVKKTTTGATTPSSGAKATIESRSNPKTNSKAASNGMGDIGNCGDKKTRCKTLIIDGDKYLTNYSTKFENRKVWQNPNPKKITSTIPGTIIKIFTKVGEEVKKGDPILILEAMKMRNKILFHADGKVKAIKVKEGETVAKDHLMLELA